MRKIAIILLLLTMTLSPYAQQKKGGKTVRKTAVTQQKGSKKNRGAKAGSRNVRASGKGTKKKGSTPRPESVKSLQQQRKALQQQIKEQEQRLSKSQRDVKKRLQNLMLLNNEIAGKQRTIDTIRHDITGLDHEIELLGLQLDKLQANLLECKERYVKSMRYMHRTRSVQNRLMFIFSADNMMQMFRRLRFMREYSAYLHVQGDEVKAQEAAVMDKLQEIARAKSKKTTLLARGEQEQRALEGRQTEQQKMVKTLQKEQRDIQKVIAEQKKKDAALNAQIDRLIAEEIARQKARAEAEARRKAEAEARRKAEAEARARRLAEAKAREEKARREAQAAKNKKDREAAERRVREAEKNRRDEERRAREDEERRVERDSRRRSSEGPLYAPSSDDVRISGSFESNRGRLPMPITGAYRIVSHYGQYNVEGLRNVRLDNKGVNILGEPGAQARSIFDGEVSAVFSFGGQMIVMVRHGKYISVYCNLSSVNVHRGQKVTTRQTLGRVGSDNILQFQLRRETAKLNPEVWLGR